jgi:uncharacterized phiE125 gp8 family phage protein
MSLVMTSGPGLEPITLAEAKAHLRVDGTAEDALIQSLIVTSRLHVEAALGLALITQSWSWFIDRWPKGQKLALPLRPVQALAAVRLWRTDGSSEVLPLDQLFLDGQAQPARLVWLGAGPPFDPGRRANGIEVAFTAGYGAAAGDVPATIRHALLLLVAHWYEHREPVEIGSGINAVPAMVTELLGPHRRRRL